MNKPRSVIASLILAGLVLLVMSPALASATQALPPDSDASVDVLLEGETVNWMYADFVSQYFHRTLADEVADVPVSGVEEWRLFLCNLGETSPTVETTVELESDRSLLTRPPASVEGVDPYTYSWDATLSGGETWDGAKVFDPESPVEVTFSPGFSVVRDVDVSLFEGPTVWTATITVESPEMPEETYFYVSVLTPSVLQEAEGNVTVEIQGASVDPPEPLVWDSGQAKFKLVNSPEQTHVFTVTMLVTPLVDAVEYRPLVRCAHYHAETVVENTVGPIATTISHPAPDCGTWEITADQVCTWNWRETIDHVVVLEQYANALPVAKATVEPYVAPVGSEFLFNGSGSYDPDGQVVSFEWDFGDGSTSTEAQVAHNYTEPGVYNVVLTVTDDDAATGTDSLVVVVYDPDDGFVTGGGWIDSPEAAYADDLALTGKASFGFVSKYKKGADTPTGQTEFRFTAGDLKFHSDSYDWLVIAGAKAMYKGAGTINGSGSYKFMLTGIDADINTNDAFNIDRFRIKIWEEVDGTKTMVYDNALGDDSDDATTEIGGGSIVIHK